MKPLTKIAYLSTHPDSWGDGIANSRFLRVFKHKFPLSSIYFIAPASTIDAIGPFLIHEGIIDFQISIPNSITNTDSFWPLCQFLLDRFLCVKFDWIIYGWIQQGWDKILSLPMFEDAKFTSIQGPAYLYQSNSRYIPSETCVSFNEILTIGSRLYSIDFELSHLRQWIVKDKPTVALFPGSTRPFSTIQPEGIWRIVDVLKNKANIIVMGAELSSWTNHFIDFWYESIKRMRDNELFKKECIDILGWGSAKQVEIVKRCDYVIIPPTGALMIPMLCNSKMIILAGGDSRVIEDMAKQVSKEVYVFPCSCSLYPCKDEPKQKCGISHIPACLGDEFLSDAFADLVETLLREK